MAEQKQTRVVSIRLPVGFLEEVDQAASDEARTRTSLIHIALKEHLERHHRQARSVA